MNYERVKTQHILILEEPGNHEIIYLAQKVYAIGRHSQNDITVYSGAVSRYHATFLKVQYNQVSEEVFWIIDGDLKGNRSTNGVEVNGKRCLSHELKHGDIIYLGLEVKIEYHKTADSYFNISAIPSQAKEKEKLEKVQENQTVIVSVDQLDNATQEFFAKLSLDPKFVPHPIIEINSQGTVVYANSIAKLRFTDIHQWKTTNPLINNILKELDNKQEQFLIRDIKINSSIFREYAHYLPTEKLIRIYLFDVTKYIESEKALQVSEVKYKAIVKQISEGIFLVDLENRRIVEANEAYCRLLNYTEQEILGLTIYDVIPLDNEIVDSYIEQIVAKRQELVLESCHCSKNQELIDVEVSVNLIEYANQQKLCFAVRDIRERKKIDKLLKRQAYYDVLTELPNRFFFNQKLESAINIAEQLEKKIAVLFIDLDHFKKINDSLGHAIGDKLLRKFAERISKILSSREIFARWGGDEFVILLPNAEDIDRVRETTEKIIKCLDNPFVVEKHQLHIRISMGVVFYPQDGHDKTTLMKNADAVLYKIKQQGRNCYQFYNPQINAESSELLILENLLYQAIARQQLSLHYQPQIDIENHQIVGIECLLRWHHPERGFIPTGKFIQIAEETGLIMTLGEWALREACQQYLTWSKLGLAPEIISVNLSVRQLQQDNLTLKIEEILRSTGLNPACLELEITESSLIEDTELAGDTLLALVNRGIKIALDDFGTGYASLSYLKKFPFHTLKIDRSFIQDITASEQNQALVAAIITLAKALNLKVVAEGVETQTQLELLRQLRCESIQGYYFSRPLNAEQASEFLTRYREGIFFSPTNTTNMTLSFGEKATGNQ